MDALYEGSLFGVALPAECSWSCERACDAAPKSLAGTAPCHISMTVRRSSAGAQDP